MLEVGNVADCLKRRVVWLKDYQSVHISLVLDRVWIEWRQNLAMQIEVIAVLSNEVGLTSQSQQMRFAIVTGPEIDFPVSDITIHFLVVLDRDRPVLAQDIHISAVDLFLAGKLFGISLEGTLTFEGLLVEVLYAHAKHDT